MIELRNVTIRAGQFTLSEISFQIASGEYVALMGRTGRGKTTILEAICGLRTVVSGDIVIHDQVITRWLPADREIGYVPQDLALFPQLTVREHLEFALTIRKRPKREIQARVSELAEVLDITHLLPRHIRGLSGGESQRVALGRALSFQPTVLLLDEPLSALDESTRSEMHALLRRVRESTPVTTLHVTHSEEEALALCDRRLVLHDGRIQEHAPHE